MSNKTRTAWGGQADQSFRGKGPEPLSQWAFIGFSLHRNAGRICKAHQSLSGSNDQGIDNIQRTIMVYSESGSDR